MVRLKRLFVFCLSWVMILNSFSAFAGFGDEAYKDAKIYESKVNEQLRIFEEHVRLMVESERKKLPNIIKSKLDLAIGIAYKDVESLLQQRNALYEKISKLNSDANKKFQAFEELSANPRDIFQLLQVKSEFSKIADELFYLIRQISGLTP